MLCKLHTKLFIVACFINLTSLRKLGGIKSRPVKIRKSLAVHFNSGRNARMATLAQISDLSSPVPSSLSMARGGCQWRSKNKVCILQCYPPTLLQPVQEVHEMDKLPLLTVIFIYFFLVLWPFLFSPRTYINFLYPPYPMKETCRYTDSCAVEYMPLLCSVCGSFLWLCSAFLSCCLSRDRETPWKLSTCHS